MTLGDAFGFANKNNDNVVLVEPSISDPQLPSLCESYGKADALSAVAEMERRVEDLGLGKVPVIAYVSSEDDRSWKRVPFEQLRQVLGS